MFLLLLCILLPSNLAHQIFNYTWQIINEAGDVAFSASSLAATTPWNSLTPDLCRLAAGASPGWGLPDTYLPLSEAPQAPSANDQFYAPAGCNSALRRTRLRESDFYVCPGGHRDRALNYRCGYKESFFCASWGCETTGDAYWHPSSTWDYIFIKKGWHNSKRNDTSTVTTECQKSHQTKGWCTPLIITFTEAGKKAPLEGWLRGHEWGLRIHVSGTDSGLTFKVRLTKKNTQYGK
uniref:Envelope protein n=1 Tax=Rousettus aegyptiacus TaxID=9407 RepID=A0A7J8KBK5_ROUAE|nr:hypothetical protein HJG63_008010 [Rousettus aegyptiacus]